MTQTPALKPGDKVVRFGEVYRDDSGLHIGGEGGLKLDPTPILEELYRTLNGRCVCFHPDTVHDSPHCPNLDLPVLARAKAWLEGR